jgi:hypothetical protein
VFELTLPVTISELVLTVTAEPVFTVRLNVLPSPLVNVNTLLVAEPVVSNDDVDTVVPAFKANEAVVANDADVANEAVPTKEPVNPLVLVTDPENIDEPILIKVFEPDTVKEPVIEKLPELLD